MITNIYPVPGTDNKALGIIDDGIERFVSEGQPDWETIQTYIKEHPEVVSDPPPPPDTRDFEMQAQAEATRQALFAENDKQLIMYMRRLLAGDETARAGFEACNAYAESLRAINNIEGWFRDPQWPEKPE